MEIRVLGPLEVWSGGTRVRIGGARAEKLLAALAVEAGRAVRVERLVDVLWDDDPPPTATRQVQNTAAALRRTLGNAVIVSEGRGYRLVPDTVQLDTQTFADRLALARDAVEADDLAKAVEEMRAALRLCRGSALAGIGSRVLASAAVELDERRLGTVEECIELELQLGRHRELIGELAALVAEHPFRERFTAQLMLALHRNGRTSDALDAYRKLRTKLAGELGLDPDPELRRLESAILHADPALLLPADDRGMPAWLGPRSQLTVLVGRDRERADLGALARRGRLVTVTGVGGVGKSSLALTVAQDLAPGFAGGVVVVALASVRGADEVILAIGAALRITGSSVEEVARELERHLARRRVLLVLDNCEHLVAACATAAQRLLAACPGLVVLATSRRPLGIAEEIVYGLTGLAGADAAELFGRRATQALPGVTLDAAPVERICARLDGLPLALELAAARLRAVPLSELADRLEDGLGLLSAERPSANPRHATLTAAIEWSYRLLGNDEQRLLARLSVFRAEFTAEAAESTCAGPPLHRDRILPTLATLVDQSMAQAFDDDGVWKYRLLEAVREYAATRLAGFDETTAVADRHLDYRLAQFRRFDTAPTLQDLVLAGLAARPEPGNLDAALEHGFATCRDREAMELTCLAFLHWMVHGTQHNTGERWLTAGWPQLNRVPAKVRHSAQFAKALLHMDRCAWLETRALLRPLADDLDSIDPRGRGEVLSVLTLSEVRTLNPAALETSRAGYARQRDSSDPDQVLLAASTVAYAQIAWGRYEQAARLCREHDDLAARAAPPYAARHLVARAQAEHGLGHHRRARELTARATDQFNAPGNFVHHSLLHRALVHGALSEGDGRDAAAHAVSSLSARYPPSMARLVEFRVLLGEAHRRAGDHDAALDLLAEGLREGAQDYAAMLPGVLSAALLANELGDHDTARNLSHDWDRIRHGLGLPVPQGFQQPAATVLGLEPFGSTPITPWTEQPLRTLVHRTTTWCDRMRTR